MKLLKRLLPIILVLSLAIAACLALAACGDLYNYQCSYANADAYTVASSGSATAIENIDIDWYNGSVVVKTVEAGGKLSFKEITEGEETTDDTTMHYLVDGNTLRIRYCVSGKISLGKLKKYLYVDVPANLTLKKVEVANVSGDISISGVTAKEVDVDNVSGATRIECFANSIKVDTVSGVAYVESDADKIDLDTVSGAATIICRTTPSKLNVDTTSGDVLLRLSGDTGFRMKFETVSGVFMNAFSSNTVTQGDSYVYLGGECSYEVNSVSGKLIIEKAGG